MASQLDLRAAAEIFADPEARKILDYLLRNVQTTLKPTILADDELRYEQVETILGHPLPDAVPLLDRMAGAGTLVAELVDKTPACPVCGSRQLSTRYSCPQCFSYNIRRTYLLEHLKCGKVGNEETFRQGDQLICPKCQAVLHEFEVEYRAVGVWYICDKCGNSFNIPLHSHFCRTKQHQITPERVQLVPVYQYSMNREAFDKIRREVLVYSEAIDLLENLGLSVQAPHSIMGKSGTPQSFDVVITGPKKTWGSDRIAVIDFLVEPSPIELDKVKAIAAKVRDARPTDGFVVAVPSLTEDARRTAANMKLHSVEASTLKEAMDKLQSNSAFKQYLG